MEVKWINHQILTGTIVYAASGDVLAAACSMAGSLLPDKVEGGPQSSWSYSRWRSCHRGLSHWPLPYLMLALVLYLAGRDPQVSVLLQQIDRLGLFILLGAVLHILEDACCGKVPLFFRQKKIGLPLFAVGSLREYLFVFAVAAVLLQGRV